ncbi:MAG TPA: hypothetical protein VF337_03605 [Candidatus Limnocylindrales bacterium]
MNYGMEGARSERERRANSTIPHVRRWTWRLGFGLSILFVWAWVGLYFMLLGLGSMADCFGAQPCADLQHQGIAEGSFWGEVFAASALVATILGIATAEGQRWAAAALVIFSISVATLTFPHPNSEDGMRATGVMAIGLTPLAVLAAWRWWSAREGG